MFKLQNENTVISDLETKSLFKNQRKIKAKNEK